MMDLSVEATDQRDRPLPVAGLQGHARRDRATVVRAGLSRPRGQHGAADLAARLLIGSCLGGVLSLTNLYIGLKGRLGLRRRLTASICSYAVWTSLLQSRPFARHGRWTILENKLNASRRRVPPATRTGGHVVSAFAAYIIVQSPADCRLPLHAGLGVSSSPCSGHDGHPMKRQDEFNIEQLRFSRPASRRPKPFARVHPRSSQGSARGQALGLAGLHKPRSTKVWLKGCQTISASLETLSSGRPADGTLAESGCSASLRSLGGPHRGLSWDFIFLAGRRHHGIAGLRDIVVSGSCAGRWSCRSLQTKGRHRRRRASPPSCSGRFWFGASLLVGPQDC